MNTISIIIPAYNEHKTIGTTLSHLTQLFGDSCEIVVVDQSDNDLTYTELQAYPQVVILKSTGKNRGSNLHQGALVTQGNLLLFLHADTLLPEQAPRILRQIDCSTYPFGAFARQFDSKLPRYSELINKFHLYRARHKGYLLGDQAVFCSRVRYQQLGGYQPRGLFEDVDFGLRSYRLARKQQQKLYRIEESVTTSSRKFINRGPLRLFVFMSILTIGYHCGVNPNKLAKWYYKQ